MYKLVVFDLDGTLADTLADLANAVNAALKEYGQKTYPIDAYKHFVGNGIDKLIENVLGDNSSDISLFQNIKDGFNAYYSQHICDFTTPYDNMDKVLNTLKKMNIKTGVISNKPDAFVPAILQSLYPLHSFDCAWGQRKEYKRKPSGEALSAMMEKLCVTKQQTLYVGDSDVDVYTAHNAKVPVCSVLWGFRDKAELVNAGADYIAENSEELLSHILGE